MLNQNHSKESSKLVEKIESLDFVANAEINSVTNLTCRNFKSTLIYNKKSGRYVANINFCGNNYKVFIKVEGDKSNPRHERKLKKVFPK